MEDSFYTTDCPTAREVASETLFKHAPDTIHLQVRFSKTDLEKVQDVDKSAFLKGLKVFGRNNYTGSASWEAYRAWLLQQDGDNVMFGSIECHKTDDIVNKIKEFGTLSGFRLWWGRTQVIDPSAAVYGIMNKMGENRYMTDDENRAIVPIQIALVAPTQAYKVNAAFTDRLEEMNQQFEHTGNPKCFILIDKPEANKKKSKDDDKDEEERIHPDDQKHSRSLVTSRI